MFDGVNTKQTGAEKESARSARRPWKRNKGEWSDVASLSDRQSKMWKDVFTSSPPKPCHSACVSTASAQLTKSISLRVCERVMRSVWVCEGEDGGGECVCALCRWESCSQDGTSLSLTSIIEASGHTESSGGGVTGQETRTPTGLSGASESLTPSTHTHIHTYLPKETQHTECIYCALTHSHSAGGQLIEADILHKCSTI